MTFIQKYSITTYKEAAIERFRLGFTKNDPLSLHWEHGLSAFMF